MGKGRLEAFSDGVIAIVITIMVLELKVPHEPTLQALGELAPIFLSYVLSFVYIGIYWNNHHHMLHMARSINGRILWANLHLLFWLSLIPFVTAWMGENHFAMVPMALYGAVMDFSGLAYYLLSRSLIAHLGEDSDLARAVGGDRKGIISLVIYTTGIVLAFINPLLAFAFYVAPAVMWFIPDPRIERSISK
ncbi:MAG: DUF1211 domain-containing protein [Anaerolineaceae bacterium]|nr:DUF1211 domain-containing protein [Anaerolineaceae bacterium]